VSGCWVEGEVFFGKMATAAELFVRGAKVAEGGELNGWVSVLMRFREEVERGRQLRSMLHRRMGWWRGKGRDGQSNRRGPCHRGQAYCMGDGALVVATG
jgi:hypothetical protein